MEYGYKTLILIDNSISIDKGNRAIIETTINYLINNKTEKDEYALATFDEGINYLTDYDATAEEQIRAIAKIEYGDHKTYITDTIMNVVNEWLDADFAMRNIVLITDGLGDISRAYPNEELYLKLYRSGYPVYVIGCVQDNNEFVMKDLAAIARMSGGKMLYTDFENSDANVEQKICQQLFEAMDEKRNAEEYKEETYSSESDVDGYVENVEGQEYDTTEYEVQEYVQDSGTNFSASEENDYETAKLVMSNTLYKNNEAFFVLLFFLIIIGILFGFLIICIRTGKRRRDTDNNFINEIRYSDKLNSGEYEDKKYEATQILRSNKKEVSYDNPDYGTRLLYEDENIYEVSFEDMNDPTRFFRQSCKDKLIIGRVSGESDIVIDYDASVSAKHCEVGFHDEEWYICDLSSSNGTWLNGRRVGREVSLNSGDLVRIGHSEFRISMQRMV